MNKVQYYIGDNELSLKKVYIDIGKVTEGNHSKISNMFSWIDSGSYIEEQNKFKPLQIIITTV